MVTDTSIVLTDHVYKARIGVSGCRSCRACPVRMIGIRPFRAGSGQAGDDDRRVGASKIDAEALQTLAPHRNTSPPGRGIGLSDNSLVLLQYDTRCR